MPLFNKDDAWLPFWWDPFLALIAGFLSGYFLNNFVVFILTGLLLVLLLLAFVDSKGRELDVLFNWGAIQTFILVLLVMWITTMSVNHWWNSILPNGILR